MKHLKQLVLCLLLALSLMSTALASEVPESLVVENLNGQQRIVKTYVLSPETDPEVLKEPSFDYDGFHYAWAYTTKADNKFSDTKVVTETVTVETAKNDLTQILEALNPTMPYDDGEYAGELALDHTTLKTEAAGYTTGSSTVTATKTIGPLDRNDMSYVPATTVKNGMTLNLSNVEWQVIGTDLVGDVLAPSSYQAVATYSGKTTYKTATGYVTTAEYKGEVTASGIENITYTVIYVGTEIVPVSEPPAETDPPVRGGGLFGGGIGGAGSMGGILLMLLGLLLLAALIAAAVYLFLHRPNVYVYIPGDRPRDYKLVAKYRAEPRKPVIDIRGITPYPEDVVAVEVKRPLAKKLMGQNFTVRHQTGEHVYAILQDSPGDWHEFNLSEEANE